MSMNPPVVHFLRYTNRLSCELKYAFSYSADFISLYLYFLYVQSDKESDCIIHSGNDSDDETEDTNITKEADSLLIAVSNIPVPNRN